MEDEKNVQAALPEVAQAATTQALPQSDPQPVPSMSIIGRFAGLHGIPPARVLPILRSTFFRVRENEPPFSDEEMAAALVVANRYNLDPFTKEIYAIRSRGALLIAVGIDGWVALAARHPDFQGWEFKYGYSANGDLESCTCTIHVRGRKVPTVVTEFLRECWRDTPAWRSNPHRLLRHRSAAQGVRMTFPLGGLISQDEIAEEFEDSISIRAGSKSGTGPLKLKAPKPLMLESTNEPQAL